MGIPAKLPSTTEGWLVIWTPILLGIKAVLMPTLNVTDESLIEVINTVVIIIDWIAARVSKKITVKAQNGGAQ